MAKLTEHVINVFVLDKNERPIPEAEVLVLDMNGTPLAGATATGSPSGPISISLASSFTTVKLRATAQSFSRELTVPVDQRNIRFQFNEIELPGAPMKPETKLAFAFGVVFVTALIVLAVFFPKPTPFQYTVFRIVLALACAGVAAVIPGMLDLQVGNFLKAAGALAVFAVVYFYSPAQIAVEPAENSVSVNLPQGLSLEGALRLLAENDAATIRMESSCEPFRSRPVLGGPLRASTSAELMKALGSKLNGAPAPTLDVSKEGAVYAVSCR